MTPPVMRGYKETYKRDKRRMDLRCGLDDVIAD